MFAGEIKEKERKGVLRRRTGSFEYQPRHIESSETNESTESKG